MAALSQAPAVAAQSYAPTVEVGKSVGANRTQGLGITAFLVGFTALTGGLYSGKVLLYLVAVALIGVSIWAFRKIKPLENSGN
jgi:hypothetical protein